MNFLCGIWKTPYIIRIFLFEMRKIILEFSKFLIKIENIIKTAKHNFQQAQSHWTELAESLGIT